MLTADTIRAMGKKNVSANGELTIQRTKTAWKAATSEQKLEVESLSGLKRVSIARVYATGIITAKVAVAIAQILNLNPLYLTGDADERGECNDNTLVSFLTTKGYPKLAKGLSKADRKQSGAPKAQAEDDIPAAQSLSGIEPLFSSAFSKSPELDKAAAELNDEEAVQLLRALLIRQKAGGNAKQLAEFVKRCLLM